MSRTNSLNRNRTKPLLAFVLAGASTLGCGTTATYSARDAHTSVRGTRAVAIVRVASPWYAPRFVIRGKFHDVLPEYEAIPALEAKYFTISEGGAFGGIYLWRGRADVEKHFDPAWHARVREKRGVEGNVVILDAPYVVDGSATPIGTPEGTRAVAFPAWATWVRWPLGEGIDAAAADLARRVQAKHAMIRTFVVTDGAAVGLVTLWATRQAAEEATSEPERSAIGRSLGAATSEHVLFEAPLLIDESLSRAVR